MARGDGTSGYLQTGSRYFPSHAPTWFSYTLDFAMGGSYYNHGMVKVGQIAEHKLSGTRVDYHRSILDNPEVINHLQVLADAAKKSEFAFLNKYQINISSDDWGGLIKAFTLLFSSQAAMEQNLKLIDQTTKKGLKKDNRYLYFVTHFASNVQTAAREIVAEYISANTRMKDFDIILDKVIEKALDKTFKQKTYVDNQGIIHTNDVTNEDKENMQVEQAYIDFLKQLNQFKNNPYFKNTILELLGVDKEFLKKTRKAQKQGYKQPQVKDAYRSGNIKGTIGEVFEVSFAELATKQLVGETSNGDITIAWDTIWSGGSGVKADVIAHNIRVGKEIVNIDGLKTQSGEEDSNRANTIQNYREWFNKMHEAYGEIVFISDKNYQIKSGFKGFEAQGKVTLNNLQALFAEIGAMRGTDIRNLIDYLANCGNDMLLTNHADYEVLNSIAMQIGNFLFDDLEVTGSSNINRLHLLNLSGFYVPLSVYLEGLIDAIENTRTQIRDFVSVSFHPAGANGAASPWDGEEDFKAFRDIQLNESYINVHFMRNFAQFITTHVKI